MPYIMKEEKHITQREIKEKTEREIVKMDIVEFRHIYNIKMEKFFFMKKK